uniref:Reverse transcriptase domain-containing protein n=1 Tax=Arundo donax TaxID=35708 RepID=A0A0A9D0U3_ARUDO
MLFILAIDPIYQILDKATEQGYLTPIGTESIKMRTSLYADDAALFVKPTPADVINLQCILRRFGETSGLMTNIHKSAVYLIKCEEINL